MDSGARDRARTGDPHVGNVFRPLDFAVFSRETAAGSRIGHARVAAILRGRYALRRLNFCVVSDGLRSVHDEIAAVYELSQTVS